MAGLETKVPGERFSLTDGVNTGKSLVALSRDGVLLVLGLLLVAWPARFNSILVSAGFEEGSFAGLKWKAKLSQSDSALVSAQATIVDLRAQNEKLTAALNETKSELSSLDLKKHIANLERINTQLTVSSSAVQSSIQATLAGNAPLVQQLQNSSDSLSSWGVVWSADTNLGGAKYETDTIAPRLGLTNVAVYYRQGFYRSAATTSDRVQAEQFLNRAKGRRADAYIVNLSSWCPIARPEPGGYFSCSNR